MAVTSKHKLEPGGATNEVNKGREARRGLHRLLYFGQPIVPIPYHGTSSDGVQQCRLMTYENHALPPPGAPRSSEILQMHAGTKEAKTGYSAAQANQDFNLLRALGI